MTLCIDFYSNSLIRCTGTNMNYIFEPKGVEYNGHTFDIKPSQKVLVIPHQPNNEGPWEICHVAPDGQGTLKYKKKTKKTFLSIVLENRWPHKSISIKTGATLDWIASEPGINADLVFILEKEIIKVKDNSPPPALVKESPPPVCITCKK